MRCMQHMPSDAPPVLALLSVLTDSLADMTLQQQEEGEAGGEAGGEGEEELLDWNREKCYGDVLFGLKNMAPHREEVRYHTTLSLACVIGVSIQAMYFDCLCIVYTDISAG